jgi:hypothetical protein
MYYNLCFPTKASFYLAAGMPILSTFLTEMKNHFSRPHAFYANLEEWHNFLSDCENVHQIIAARDLIKNNNFNLILWPTLWSDFLLTAQQIIDQDL